MSRNNDRFLAPIHRSHSSFAWASQLLRCFLQHDDGSKDKDSCTPLQRTKSVFDTDAVDPTDIKLNPYPGYGANFLSLVTYYWVQVIRQYDMPSAALIFHCAVQFTSRADQLMW